MFKTKAHTGPTRGSNVTGIHTVTRPVHTTLLLQLLSHTINKKKAGEAVRWLSLTAAAGGGLAGVGEGVGLSVLLSPGLRVLFMKLRSDTKNHH